MHVFHEIPDSLRRSIETGSLVPFVGAGVSRSVKFRGTQADAKCFPLWNELIKAGAEELSKINRIEADAVLAQLRTSQPDLLTLATKLREQMGPPAWARYLRDQLNPQFARIDDVTLRVARLIWGLQSHLIVTTNYDKVLQWACPRPQDMERIVTDEPFQLAKIHQFESHSSPIVWHIHGHIECPDAMILTTRDYQALYGATHERSQRVRATLGQLFLTKSFLFVGFGMQDPKINDVLSHYSAVFGQYGREHYMLTRREEVEATKYLLNNAGLQNIHIITFEGFGAPLESRLEELNRLASGTSLAPPVDTTAEHKKSAKTEEVAQEVSYGLLVQSRFTRERGHIVNFLHGRPEWKIPTPIEEMTTENCLSSSSAMEKLPAITGLGQAELHRILQSRPGAKVSEALRDHWPDSEALGTMSSERILEYGLEGSVARLAELDRENTYEILAGASQGTQAASLFAHWPKRTLPPSPIAEPLNVTQDMDPGAHRVKIALRLGLAPQIATITGLRVEHVERELQSVHGNMKVRALFADAWPTDEEIGDMRADTVLRLGLESAVAQIVGWAVPTVRESLRGAEEGISVRIALESAWPEFLSGESQVPETTYPTDTLFVQRFGRTTTATARRHGEAVNAIALITGLDLKVVIRRLAKAHGKTRIERVFEAEWPSDDMLGEYTVAQIRNLGLVGTVAEILGASAQAIDHELNQVFGQKKLRSIYPEVWGNISEPEPVSRESTRIDVGDSDLGYLTVSEARRMQLENILTELTKLSAKAVDAVLTHTHGRTHLRKAFEQVWPSDDEIGNLRVTVALRLSLCGTISRITGISADMTRNRLKGIHGKNQVRTCFSKEWPQ